MKQLVKPLVFQSWISQIINSSLYQSWSKNDSSFRSIQVEVVNIFSICVICINFLTTFLNFWGVYHLYGAISLFALIVLLVNKWQHFTTARWLFISGIYLLVFLLVINNTGWYVTDLILLLSVVTFLFLFSREEIWEYALSSFILIMLYLCLQVTGFSVFELAPQTDNRLDQAFMLNLGCILLSVALAIYYVFSVYEKSENNLKRYVKELQAKEIEINLQNEELLKLNASLIASKEDLVKNHLFLNTIIDNLPVTLFVKEAKSLKFIRLNKTGEALTEYSEKEIINKTNDELFQAEQAIQFTESDKRVLAENKIIATEEYFTNKSNQVHVVHTKKVPIYGKNGDPLYILGIIEDITPRKQAEEILRKTVVELETRNHELDNYTYRVSHDLRSPLCSMLGLVNLAKLEGDIDTIKQYIHLIEKSVIKSDKFIQSILNHSKILNTAPQIELIDLEKLIYDCLEELNFVQENERIQMIITVDAKKAFYNDTFRVNTILRNLLSNALKYFNPDIADPFIKFDIRIDEKSAHIIVEDNGIGIDAQYLPKVFDMFFRGTEKSSGSGLGLYIVKQAVETLNAAITIQSEAGKGTKSQLVIANRCV